MGALKVVADNAESPTEAPSSTVKAAAAGSQRELLVALRDNIAGQIDDGVPPRDLASLSRRLLEIAKELATLDAAEREEGDGNGGTPDAEFDPSAI